MSVPCPRCGTLTEVHREPVGLASRGGAFKDRAYPSAIVCEGCGESLMLPSAAKAKAWGLA